MSETSELIDTKAEFKSYATLHPFILAGNATFTLVSKLTNKRFTYKISRTDFNPTKFFVNVLNGPDNENSYEYLGMVNSLLNFEKGRKSRVTDNAPSLLGIKWFFRMMQDKADLIDKCCEVWHEGKCGRCGRKLTVPSSIESGFGPECASKL